MEVKFRAWKNGRLYEHDELFDIDIDLPRSRFTSAILYDEYELEQFTGLYDKNGEEIYEGDILKCKKNCLYDDGYCNKEVDFDRGMFMCGTVPASLQVESFDAEIIGNIHEGCTIK